MGVGIGSLPVTPNRNGEIGVLCVESDLAGVGDTTKHEKQNERMKTERTNDQGHKVIQRHTKLVLGIIRSQFSERVKT